MEWVSVKSKNPPRNQNVLVFSTRGFVTMACYKNNDRWDGDEEYNWWWDELQNSITHWMEITPPPESPK